VGNFLAPLPTVGEDYAGTYQFSEPFPFSDLGTVCTDLTSCEPEQEI